MPFVYRLQKVLDFRIRKKEEQLLNVQKAQQQVSANRGDGQAKQHYNNHDRQDRNGRFAYFFGYFDSFGGQGRLFTVFQCAYSFLLPDRELVI